MQHQQKSEHHPVAAPFTGILEIDSRGGGFVRTRSLTLDQRPTDVHVTPRQLRDNSLRPGVELEGVARQGRPPHPVMEELHRINGRTPRAWASVPEFGSHEVISPYEWIRLEGKDDTVTGRLGERPMRIVDLFCRSQRPTRLDCVTAQSRQDYADAAARPRHQPQPSIH
jgi:transcription termination factor Rho